MRSAKRLNYLMLR